MKKSLLVATLAILAVTGSGLAAAHQAAKPAAQKPKSRLPEAVVTAFEKAYPEAVIKASSRETEAGKTVYEIESVDKGLSRDLLYAADGTVLECEEQVREAELPAAVTASLKHLYPNARITKAERTTKGQVVQYDLAVKGAPKAEVSFFPDGRAVSATPEKK